MSYRCIIHLFVYVDITSHMVVPYGTEVDDNGVGYLKICIHGDEFCGYRCFACSVYEDQDRLLDIC